MLGLYRFTQRLLRLGLKLGRNFCWGWGQHGDADSASGIRFWLLIEEPSEKESGNEANMQEQGLHDAAHFLFLALEFGVVV